MLEGAGITRRSGQRLLLDHITITIPPGARWALVGPTGSGKTLLLRALSLLDPLDEGEVRWEGRRVGGDRVPAFRSRVIYLHQHPSLLEGTVEDNLRSVFQLHVHRTREYHRDRIVALLESLGRDESFLNKDQRNLSGGEQQIAALLRAIQVDPVMLLLDEPTAALDERSTIMVETLIDHWFSEHPRTRSLLWVTHDRTQAERVANRVLPMKRGRLEEDGDGRVH